MKLEIPTKQLEAALHLAAKKDTRFYLNSVFFDATRMNLVASDGCAIYIGAPDTLPNDIDYAWYVRAAYDMLNDCGYYSL